VECGLTSSIPLMSFQLIKSGPVVSMKTWWDD
jgi:hypothetical protein